MGFNSILPSACVADAIPVPSVFGADVLDVSAVMVTNYSQEIAEIYNYGHGSASVQNASFCNITLSYTHPGVDDVVVMEAWLPTDTWNGRLLGAPGGGWLGGRFILTYQTMAAAIGEGYMAFTTDAGHSSDLDTPIADWGLLSPGNVDLFALNNFGSVTLNDTGYMAKALSESMYGQKPEYSYWTGCSGGGRQGLMLAQRYPEIYDGIAALAPAIYWSEFITGNFWAQLIMNMMGEYPPSCVFDAFVAAAVEFCDENDGVHDGIIADPQACAFDPTALVGTSVICPELGGEAKISEGAAQIVNLTWTGPRGVDGDFLFYGQNMGGNLTGGVSTQADTVCNDTCRGLPNSLPSTWIKVFLAKDADYNLTTLNSIEKFESLFKGGVQQYDSIIGTTDPDLSAFRKTGGKILTYHGLADEIIPASATRHYYEAVTSLDPNVHDFFRLFESPGLAHCAGGPGALPNGIFNSLVEWVEHGTVPEHQIAFLPPRADGTRGERLLCPYPQKPIYDGVGDVDITQSYHCQ